MHQKSRSIIKEVKKAVIGKDEIIEKVLMVILAQGHILLEDNPGVGKTTLALAFSKAINLDYKRIQFTPEIMPADVVGYSMYNKITGRLEYQPGAALCNLLLADEINRTSSKTQSALLQAMEEGSITIDSVTHQIPKPYTVIATQNPTGSAGTQHLPESQMDRFMVRLSMGYPNLEDEVKILKQKQGENPLEKICQAATTWDILNMQKQVDNVHIADDIFVYIARLAEATRKNPFVSLGISPRGSGALVRMSRAAAWLSERDYVIPSDIRSVFFDVLEHRLILNSQANAGNMTSHDILSDILKSVASPKLI